MPPLFKTKDDALRWAMLNSAPGDVVWVHRAYCALKRPEADLPCSCTPERHEKTEARKVPD